MNKESEKFGVWSIALVVIVLILIVGVVIFLGHDKESFGLSKDVKLSGKYYEDVSKLDSTGFYQQIYSFNDDKTCMLESSMYTFAVGYMSVKEYCKYEINGNKLIIDFYGTTKDYSKVLRSQTKKLSDIDGGISIDGTSFLRSESNQTKENKKKAISRLALECGIYVAQNLRIQNSCVDFKEVGDGFFNYICGKTTIRLLVVNDYQMTYDVYNSNYGRFLSSGYCYGKNYKETNNGDTSAVKDNTDKTKPNIDVSKVQLNKIGIKEFMVLLNNNTKSVIYISRPECSYCQQQEPILKTLVGEYGIDVNYLNTNELEIDEFNTLLSIDTKIFGKDGEKFGTPSILIVQSGKINDSLIGLTQYDELKEFFQKNMVID